MPTTRAPSAPNHLHPQIKATQRARRLTLAAAAIAALCAGGGVAYAQATPAVNTAEFAQRFFARKVATTTPAATNNAATLATAAANAPGRVIVDPVTKESNELIVRLNLGATDRLSLLAPGLAKNAAAPAVERAFQREVQSRGKNVDYATGGAIHARYMVQVDRMTDEDRAANAGASAEARALGFDYDPRERLDQYMVLRYDSVGLARAAHARMKADNGFAYVSNNSGGGAAFSSTPNDAYFSYGGSMSFVTTAQFQWGLHQMQFPAAWDKTRGQSYIGVMDRTWPGEASATTSPMYPTPAWTGANLRVNITTHPDLVQNFRKQMIAPEIIAATTPAPYPSNPAEFMNYRPHTVHVAGIIAATQNNGAGGTSNTGWTAGACPECSFVTYPVSTATYMDTGAFDISLYANSLRVAVDSGMQVINWSGGSTLWNCTNAAPICDALAFATLRSVLLVQAAGNNNNVYSMAGGPHFPANLHASYSLIPVGGIAPNGQRWTTGVGVAGGEAGSNFASTGGVVGPALDVVSTITANYPYSTVSKCGDTLDTDTSGGRFGGTGYGDGVGSCTGTSMAAPHISALAGLVWSVNPRATANEVRTIIRQAGNNASSVNVEYGYGLPNALTAVNAALATNPSRLTPLFSYYGQWRSDSFYTTVPQQARAAATSTLRPRVRRDGMSDYQIQFANKYQATWGNPVQNYTLPGASAATWGGDATTSVRAEVWVFTTDQNPKNAAIPLRPLYRMSWKCGDPSNVGQPYTCNSVPDHVDTVLVDKDELAYFSWLGYQVDGIEGFVYPKTQPQPPGTVRLMRKYHADKDDHAVFPETALSSMVSQGWQYNTNYNDWLGYVYPNTGTMPTVQ